MIVSCYADHLAYTFEAQDALFMLGMKVVNKLEEHHIPMVQVLHNQKVQLLYGVEGYRRFTEAMGEISSAELVTACIHFLQMLKRMEDNDFLEMKAVDIKLERLYYDGKNKEIKAVILPINYECDLHDACTWSYSFRNTMLMIFNQIFVNMPDRQTELYYVVMDQTKTDAEVLHALISYDFGIQAVEHTMENTGSEKTLLLEHNGSEGNLIFIVDKPEFLIGKSKEADGTIANSTKVSRNHCRIVRENGSYMIQDLESTNGTIVNGYTLEPDQKYYLKDGDSLVLADVEFKVTVS